MRIKLLISLSVCLLLWPSAVDTFGQPRATRQPNIIMILADDLGWGDTGFNGRTTWRTPNLARIAQQGTTFRRWYMAAVVCAPRAPR